MYTKASGRMISAMGRELCYGKTGPGTRGISSRTSNTAMAPTRGLINASMWVLGIWERDQAKELAFTPMGASSKEILRTT